MPENANLSPEEQALLEKEKERLAKEEIRKRFKNPVGRPFKIKSAEVLWDLFIDYCYTIDKSPWMIKTASNSISDAGGSKNNGMRQDVRPLQRAYTLYGFCHHAGIFSKWADFRRTNVDRPGFKQVMDAIENAVIAQQLDGALLHQFDSGLVARLSGIADRQEIVETDFKFPKLSQEDIDSLKKENGL